MATNGRPAGEAVVARARPPAGRFALDPVRLPTALRWVAAGLGVLLLALALAVGTRRTSVFSVRQIQVSGTSGAKAASVRRALKPLLGRSLASLHRADVVGRLSPLPVVTAATYDRSFPHTLKVFVRTERPLAVLRRGAGAWVVSERGRILSRLPRPSGLRRLPRVWLGKASPIPRVGAAVTGPGRQEVAALGPVAGSSFLRQVRGVGSTDGQVTLALRSGLELRLGAPTSVALKLAIAQRIAPSLDNQPSSYLDLTVPERPVAGSRKSKVAG